MKFVVGKPPTQKEFVLNMELKKKSAQFSGDMKGHLNPNLKYDQEEDFKSKHPNTLSGLRMRSKFNYLCIDDLESFLLAEKAITIEGLTKNASRHEKDDRPGFFMTHEASHRHAGFEHFLYSNKENVQLKKLVVAGQAN